MFESAATAAQPVLQALSVDVLFSLGGFFPDAIEHEADPKLLLDAQQTLHEAREKLNERLAQIGERLLVRGIAA